MTTHVWVKPQGWLLPPGTELKVELQQDADVGGGLHKRPLSAVGKATIYEGGRALLRIVDTEPGRVAVELLREQLVDPVYWGSKPTLRLRP